jgi:hypothetical protein
MAKNTRVATIRTGLNICLTHGFVSDKAEPGGRDPSTHQLELCLEADQEPRSGQGNYSTDSEQDCDSTRIEVC